MHRSGPLMKVNSRSGIKTRGKNGEMAGFNYMKYMKVVVEGWLNTSRETPSLFTM